MSSITKAMTATALAATFLTIVPVPGLDGAVLGVSVAKAESTSGIVVRDRKSTRLNSSHEWISRMPSSA